MMSKTAYWAWTASVLIAVVIMFATFLIMRIKIKKIKQKYGADNPIDGVVKNKAVEREDHGQLLWDLKDKTKNPTLDLTMEFIINTSIRNGYKSFDVLGFEEKYEEESFKRIAKMRKLKTKQDIKIVKFTKEFIDEIDKELKTLNDKGLMVITQAPKNKDVRNLMHYLKLTRVRHEWMKVNNGIVLVAK